MSADELLPADGQMQQGGGVGMLEAASMIGINTVGNSLRNANLQIRSEPANPRADVGPWMNSTIEPDLMRVPLELGCGGQ